MVGVSAVISIATQIVQPGALFTQIMNWWKYSKGDENINLFQYQLNVQLQDPEFNFARQYAFYLVMVYIASFFTILTPLASLLIALVFMVQYWVDKFNLFKRFSYSFDIGFFLSKLILKAFECSLVIFAVGHIIWKEETKCQQADCSDVTWQLVLRIVNLGLASLYVIVSLFGSSRI